MCTFACDKLTGLEYIKNNYEKFDIIQLPLTGFIQEYGTIEAIFQLLNNGGKLITFQDAHQEYISTILESNDFKFTKGMEYISVDISVEIPQALVPRVVKLRV